MTKVQLSYNLVRPLGEGDFDSIARVHGVFGIHRVVVSQPGMNSILVEYDASRLMPDDVEAALLRTGVPISRT